MKSVKKHYSLIVFLLLCVFAAPQSAAAQSALSPQEKQLMTDFEKRAKDYLSLRKRIEGQIPKLPKEATAEQIEAYKISFQKAVQSARNGAKRGEIFTPETEALIRKIIKNQYQGQERVELRKTVLEADTKGVPVRINYPYPDSKEQVEMPPMLLLILPKLPEQLRYRFVGNNLLLLDRENSLIIDYMTNALP